MATTSTKLPSNGTNGHTKSSTSQHGNVGIDENGKKTFIPLENNPALLTPLAHRLGLHPSLAFHDLYSFTEPDLIAIVPRPALALLFVWPCTWGANEWHAEDVVREREGLSKEAERLGKTEQELLGEVKAGVKGVPVWFRQDVEHACGLMGIIHCALNVPAALMNQLALDTSSGTKPNGEGATTVGSPILAPDSILSTLRSISLQHQPTQSPADVDARAALISQSTEIEKLHTEAAISDGGGSNVPALGEEPGHAFIAFVRDEEGSVWELDGARSGPKLLGKIGQDEDLLSPAALQLGPLPYIERQAARKEEISMEGGTVVNAVEFSCTVLAPSE
ncbi:Ubiquitin carboxyl-terminal hydrolase YUH1 [Cyphellophora attinorum]|uniref:Ubiquitin carboxyl-terminal hydrolase n=1 Tax=Cyphellophora attinorum TaxID=1664694 RepID=A0A0N0NHN7_9EURO|nr:Ubiquitin carboxyl-terminal hydrolase YUH1 [Phialophora attinorum]KPI34778.1 Ubiquitin carboxyl-terminal hydrolase YUH1 [Phialophora attinorum]